MTEELLAAFEGFKKGLVRHGHRREHGIRSREEKFPSRAV